MASVPSPEVLGPEAEYEREVPADVTDSTSLALLNKSEIDQQVSTAKKYPRSIQRFRNEALQLATLDEQTAGECIYALPRDGKTIEGPSARFAEILAYSWGNCRAGARTVGEESDFTTSQGAFYDLEKNVAISYEVKRRIVDKHGRRFKPDMIGVTSNAASSVALRNAILKGIPKALWKPVYDAARKTVAGDFKTLANRREEALEQFRIFGVTPEMIYKVLGIAGKPDITIDHLVLLKGMLTALREGESTVEDMFANKPTGGDNIASSSAKKAETLNEAFAKKEPESVKVEGVIEPPEKRKGKKSDDGVPLKF